MRQGLEASPEFKLLLTQYVSIEIPFGGQEFATLFGDIVKKDSSIPRSIGAPSLFLFTADGETVYAGPNRQSGVAIDDELKRLLVSGLEENGGLQRPNSPGKGQLTRMRSDVRKAQSLAKRGQPLAAAEVLGAHLSNTDSGERLRSLVELTGLPLSRSKAEEEVEALARKLGAVGQGRIKATLALVADDKVTIGAVKLAELERAFGSFRSLEPELAAAWQSVKEKAGSPQIVEQARTIDEARRFENQRDVAKAVDVYRRVTTKFPDTEAARLSQQRLQQLESGRSNSVRTWKSRDGNYAVKATLLSFDGTTAKLKTADGRTIDVPAANLSDADQAFLRKP